MGASAERQLGQRAAADGPRAVIVTPNLADGALARGFLEEAGIEALVVARLAELQGVPESQMGCLLTVEEALVSPELEDLQESMLRQPPWSDLPIVLIARESTPLGTFVQDVFPQSGNITLLQRPLHPMSLVSAVRVALRARARQYQVRELLLDRERAVKQRDEFLAMLAHELRNPLAPIRNAVHLLGTLSIDNPLFTKCRSLIDKQARHITRLVEDLVDVSRLERGKVELRRQRVNLEDCAGAAVEACQPVIASYRHTVTLAGAAEPVMVMGDAVRLEQAVGNLVLNAAKFTPEGGAIEVSVRREGGLGVVCVADNGMGIKPEMLEAIFELFTQDDVTLARSRGGLGIGLTLVKRIIELHGGVVRAYSAGPGAGARFEARLPLLEAGFAEEAGMSSEDGTGVSRRVLIVEDGADTRETLGMLVSTWRHEVLFASNGPEGLARAREAEPDVMLVDIGLPGFDGYELARSLRKLDTDWSRRVTLIALTGYGQEADRERATQAGFDIHLLKPVDPMHLRRVLHEEAAPGG